MAFSKILKDLRETYSLSQKEVANACNLSTQCISALETGTRNPTGSTIKTLAEYFQVTADYLLELEDDFGQRQPRNDANGLNAEERQLIEDYRNLSPALKKMLQDTIQTWQRSEANKKLKA